MTLFRNVAGNTDVSTLVGPPQAQGSYVQNGGDVAFVSGYTFLVSPVNYYINGTSYTAAQTSISLDSPDATNNRFDAIVATTSSTITKVTGVAGVTPYLPDTDPQTQLVLTYILVQGGSSAANISTTSLYLENTEWTSSISGGFNAASTNNPYAGTKDIEATSAAAGDYVRLTNGAPVSLSNIKQIVFQIRSKAAWSNSKSLLITWYLSGVKIGVSASLADTKYGFSSSNIVSYQQIVIPISTFQIPAATNVDRVEFKVNGGGGAIGFYLDNVILETNSTSVSVTPTTTASASISGTVKTDLTDSDPKVYLKSTIDSTFATKLNAFSSPTSLGANQNNYTLPSSRNIRLTASTTVNITGFAATSDGDEKQIINIGSSAITFKHQSASSSSGNKFQCFGVADIVLAQYDSVYAIYDSTSGHWWLY